MNDKEMIVMGRRVLWKERKKLSKSGGSIFIYLNPSQIRKVGMKVGDTVDVRAYIEGGESKIEIAKSMVGHKDLVELARREGWKIRINELKGDEWFFGASAKHAYIEADYSPEYEGTMKNINISSDSVMLSKIEDYDELNMIAKEHRLEVFVLDNRGLWLKARGSIEAKTGRASLRDVTRRLLKMEEKAALRRTLR